jgi:hypothetical protein
MATQETQYLDNIIASRRALLVGGGATALAAAFLPKAAKAANTVSSYTDFDILNFALNLEYLEANFYYMAAFGCTIEAPNTAAQAAGAPSAGIGIGSGTATAGTPATTTGAAAVPFTLPAVKAYAIETAIEEGKHVLFLRSAIQQNGGTNVAQPPIDLSVATFSAIAQAAMVGAPFYVNGVWNPYASDVEFLSGAYLFEDVGVTAYAGAAPLISTTTTGKAILQAAASILAVEAYHAGLIRSTIYAADPANANGYLTGTQLIAQTRASLAHASGVAPSPTPAAPMAGYAYPDDFGLYPGTYPQAGSTNPPATGTVSLAGGAAVTASNIADADPTNVIAFGRTTTQVLNIVTKGNAATAGTKATGGFFPQGLNGTFS